MSISLDDWAWSRLIPIKGLPVIKTHDWGCFWGGTLTLDAEHKNEGCDSGLFPCRKPGLDTNKRISQASPAATSKRKPRLQKGSHDSRQGRATTHDCHDCTTHDCQVFTTTTEAGHSTTHDHDWFQSLIIIPAFCRRIL